MAVGERNVLRHEKPCLSASGGIDQLAVGIQYDRGLFAIGRKMAQRQVLSGKRRQFIRNDRCVALVQLCSPACCIACTPGIAR